MARTKQTTRKDTSKAPRKTITYSKQGIFEQKSPTHIKAGQVRKAIKKIRFGPLPHKQIKPRKPNGKWINIKISRDNY
jgi:hypothetical protein